MRATPAAALVALLLIATGCTDEKDRSNDVASPYNSDDVNLPRPQLKVAPSGAWEISADFAWRICGERACWTSDDRHHGGPDVFGVYWRSGPRFTGLSKRLTLRSSCGKQNTVNDAVIGEEGIFFLVQDKTDEDEGCGSPSRDFNMAEGHLEVIVTPSTGPPCPTIFPLSALFAHSWGDTGRNVKVNAGPTQYGRYIDWGGGDETHQFQSVGSAGGNYDCSGIER